MEDIIIKILETNPGVVTILISSFLLPIIILFLNNRQNQKIKELEGKLELEKTEHLKKLELKYTSKIDSRNHENVVHSSLVKILFGVQQLHIALSGSCVDYNCIDKAIADFQSAFDKYQNIISDNQLFLSSKVTNHLYRFYQLLAELLIELQDLKTDEKYELAIVSVYNYSHLLAEETISIQEIFAQQREELLERFKRTEMSMMSYCCGQRPSEKLTTEYNGLKTARSQLPTEIERVLEIQNPDQNIARKGIDSPPKISSSQSTA